MQAITLGIKQNVLEYMRRVHESFSHEDNNGSDSVAAGITGIALLDLHCCNHCAGPRSWEGIGWRRVRPALFVIT